MRLSVAATPGLRGSLSGEEAGRSRPGQRQRLAGPPDQPSAMRARPTAVPVGRSVPHQAPAPGPDPGYAQPAALGVPSPAWDPWADMLSGLDWPGVPGLDWPEERQPGGPDVRQGPGPPAPNDAQQAALAEGGLREIPVRADGDGLVNGRLASAPDRA